MSLYTLPPTQYALDYSPGALDLSRSRRVGSVEPRKTPSPSMASPNGYISPSYPTSPRFTQYLTYQEVARPLRKTPSPYEEPRQSKVEDDMGAYLLQAAAFQQQLIQSRIAQSCHSSDDASETGDAFQGYPVVRDAKVTRPFKAYPKDPLALAAGFTAADALLDTHSAEKYSAFRKRMLDQIHAANGGQATVSNPKMRRNIPPANTILEEGNLEGHVKDVAYFERRKKNNAAAKKSRDRRRVKEDEIAIRAAFLERENIELKIELASARKQLSMYSLPTLPV